MSPRPPEPSAMNCFAPWPPECRWRKYHEHHLERGLMSNKLLPGVRVLDLSRILAGPWTSQLLADYGAEVIKVERPGVGDDARRFGPPFLKDREGRDTLESPMFVGANRNKKSITINLAKPEGQALVKRLAEKSDIFIENY